MPKNLPSRDDEQLVNYFYDLVTDRQALAPASLPQDQAEFVRLTVETEQAAAGQPSGVDFERIWQQALKQGREVSAAGTLDMPESLPVSLPERRKKLNWPLALVAGLTMAIITGLLIVIVSLQSGLDRLNKTGSNSTSAAPPSTPVPTPKPSFNGFDLTYPNANSLVVAPNGLLNDSPSQALVNPTRLAFGTSDKPDAILAYYRQKLAAYTDYIEDRPASPHQFNQGLVAFNGPSMLVINLYTPTKRENFEDMPGFFKLFQQMQSDQTLLLVSYGRTPTLTPLPDLSLPDATSLANVDLTAWPELYEPFSTIDNFTMVRPTQTAFATDKSFVEVVNYYKDTLAKAGYQLDRDSDNDMKGCSAKCEQDGWDVFTAYTPSRGIFVRIYSPSNRSKFTSGEIERLTAQGLKPNQTLVSYKTGLNDGFRSTASSGPDLKTASLAWSPDGALLATSLGNEVRFWKDGAKLSDILQGFQAPVNKLAWSPDGKFLAISSGTGVQIWSFKSGKLTPYSASHSAPIKILAWSPDSTLLATAAGCLTETSNTCDQRVFLWQTNGSVIATLPGHKGSPNVVLWSPDGQQLATEQNDANPNNSGTVRIWDRQGMPVYTLDAHAIFEQNMAWLPSIGERILVTSSPSSPGNIFGPGLSLWNTGKDQLSTTSLATFKDVTALAWSPDGKLLAVAEADNAVRLWDYRGSKLVKTIYGHTDRITILAWTSNSETLATSSFDNTVRLWDRQGNQLSIYRDATTPLSAIGWSKDGSTMYGLSVDKQFWLWDTTNQDKPLLGWQGNLAGAQPDRAGWSPDGSKFAVYYESGTVYTWNKRFSNLAGLQP